MSGKRSVGRSKAAETGIGDWLRAFACRSFSFYELQISPLADRVRSLLNVSLSFTVPHPYGRMGYPHDVEPVRDREEDTQRPGRVGHHTQAPKRRCKPKKKGCKIFYSDQASVEYFVPRLSHVSRERRVEAAFDIDTSRC